MRRRNGETKVIDSFRVRTVYGDLKNGVFVVVLNRTVCIVFLCNGVLRTVYGNVGNCHVVRTYIRLTKGFNTRNVRECKTVFNVCVQQDRSCFCRVLRKQRTARTPFGKNVYKERLYGIIINKVNSRFFRRVRIYKFFIVEIFNFISIGSFRTRKFCILRRDTTFIKEELENIVFKQACPFFVGGSRYVERFFCCLEVRLQFFLERVKRELIVCKQHRLVVIQIGNRFGIGICRNCSLITRRNSCDIVDSSFHLFFGCAIRSIATRILFTFPFVNRTQFTNSVSCISRCRASNRFAQIGSFTLFRLISVFVQTFDINRVHRRRTGIYGVEIFVHIEQYVVHRKGFTVRELQAVFQNERVYRLCVFRTFVLRLVVEIKNYGRFVLTCGRLTFFIRCKHTNLGHTNNVHIRTCRCVEGVEQTTQFFRHYNDTVFLRATRVVRIVRVVIACNNYPNDY